MALKALLCVSPPGQCRIDNQGCVRRDQGVPVMICSFAVFLLRLLNSGHPSMGYLPL